MSTRLWWLRTDDFSATPAQLALLDPEERQQQQRYIPPAKQHEYLLTRILVRSVLGEMLAQAPESLSFVKNIWGRPFLVPDSDKPALSFNVSHSDGLIVCLVSSEYEVGVDTENLSRAPTLLKLAAQVFAPDELNELRALPASQQEQRAVDLWTLKESYIKACGKGLAIPLDSFSFAFKPGVISLKTASEGKSSDSNWIFQTRSIGSHIISTALVGQGQQGVVDYCEFRRTD